MTIILDPSQQHALNIILQAIERKQKVISLSGVAGTGKTTLMKKVIETVGKKVILLSPTGKAAVRLKEVVGRSVNTIHSALYGGAEEDENGKLIWIDPKDLCAPNCLVIVDEASMVSDSLAADLESKIPNSSTVLYVGDPFQVPPVNAEPGVDLENPTAKLLTVHRQATDNPVLAFSINIRSDTWPTWLKSYQDQDPRLKKERGLITLVDRYSKELSQGLDSIAICYTNDTRKEINKAIRDQLGHRAILQPGTKLIVKANNKMVGAYNGEIFTIEKLKIYNHLIWGRYAVVKFLEKKTQFMISLKHLGASQSEWRAWTSTIKKLPVPFILVDYGYCLTTHSSQGSEWQNVHYFWEPAMSRKYAALRDPEERVECNRIFYTAVTRTSNQLTVYRE